MEEPATSAIKDLNAALKSGNPFEGRSTVREPDLWGSGSPDWVRLNLQATEAVWEEIEQLQTDLAPVRSLVLLADSGMGKSHVLSRIRHQLQAQGQALFAYINAQQFTDTTTIRQQLLSALVDSLRYPGRQGVMQWQELALFIVNQALALSHPHGTKLAARKLIRKLSEQTLAKNQLWVNQVTEILFRAWPEVENPDLFRAIVWTLCNAQAPFARNWLAGRKLTQWKLEELGLPDRPQDNPESMAWESFLQISEAIERYLPLVICFDQLEADDLNEAVVKKEQVVASLVKRLSDSLRQRPRQHGALFISMMEPATWNEKLLPFLGKFVHYICGSREPIPLDPLDGETIANVVAQWLQDFYGARQLTPPTPIYPFEVHQIQALERENLTLREIIEWCAENFQPVEIDPIEKVEKVFNQVLQTDWSQVLESDLQIADALYFSFKSLIGKCVEGVQIEAVTRDVSPKSLNRNYIHFKIVCRQSDRLLKIGVAVMQKTHGKTVNAALKRLIQYDGFDLTRGCLIRHRAKVIPPRWQARRHLHRLIAELGGRWVDLDPASIAPLLALHAVYLQRNEDQLREAQILEFMDQRQLVEKHPFIAEILRSPPESVSEETPMAEAENELNAFPSPPVQTNTNQLSPNPSLSPPFQNPHSPGLL